jgi:hypothetical protein
MIIFGLDDGAVAEVGAMDEELSAELQDFESFFYFDVSFDTL